LRSRWPGLRPRAIPNAGFSLRLKALSEAHFSECPFTSQESQEPPKLDDEGSIPFRYSNNFNLLADICFWVPSVRSAHLATALQTGVIGFDNFIDWLAPAYLITLISLPAATAPVGLSADGLPIVAARFEKPLILRVAGYITVPAKWAGRQFRADSSPEFSYHRLRNSG
jgi:hypothetical protein